MFHQITGAAVRLALATMPIEDLVALADSEERMMWRGHTANKKTADVVSVYVGRTKTESRASCDGCPLLPSGPDGYGAGNGKGRCYAHKGTPSLGAASMRKRFDRLGRERGGYSFASVVDSLRGRWLRDAQLGDTGNLDPIAVRAAHTVARRLGKGVIAYTHHWRAVAARGDADLYTASCDGGLSEVDEALALGFRRASVVIPWDSYAKGKHVTTPAGAKGIICPALWRQHVDGRDLSCADCGICDPQKKGPAFVAFPDHGPSARAQAKKRARLMGDDAPRWLRSLAGLFKKA